MRMRTWLLSTTCLAGVAAMGAAQAAGLPDGYGGLPDYGSLPAVSAPNGKLSAFGGSRDGSIFGVTGSFAVPLGHAFGLQIDGAVGSAKSAAFYGFGGHVFWRDPAKGLLGLYSSYAKWDAASTASATTLTGGVIDTTGAEVGKIGAEGAAYLGRVSLEGFAGYQFGSRTGFTGKATLAFYPTDDLRLDGGVRYLDGIGTVGTIGAEWRPHEGSGLTLYAAGAAGNGNYRQILGGVRFYFADQGKSLIRRHREDDPGVDLPDDLFTTTGGVHCPAGQSITTFDGNTFCQ